MKILIVDDDYDVRNIIKLYLANENYEILEADDGIKALEIVDETVDLVLLDVMMPRMDGIQTCVKMREKYVMPIIFITAKSEDVDKLTAFSFGGDDYITKPFNPIELTARVKASIRRYKNYQNAPIQNSDEVKIGNLKINLTSHTVYKNDALLKLTRKEFAILALLIKNRGRVYNLEQIYTNVWGEESILNAESTVPVHIKNLREKIEDNFAEPEYIKTVWGVGYRVD